MPVDSPAGQQGSNDGMGNGEESVPRFHTILLVSNKSSIISLLQLFQLPSIVWAYRTLNRPRLLKVILPSSYFRNMVLNRAPRLKSFHSRIFIRPSLSKAERDGRMNTRE
ncbi:hypothetical protein ANCCAN_13102 [Ancylostoma caninum]|uniref:Uncharacterized protein n=1 Tax=Ancylostoma caninum TaxID=29170 RepID=A0A368GD67_ANCCA|nr:hypothetical protein ANCCAN_13102 [Ancylostoma caninum]